MGSMRIAIYYVHTFRARLTGGKKKCGYNGGQRLCTARGQHPIDREVRGLRATSAAAAASTRGLWGVAVVVFCIVNDVDDDGWLGGMSNTGGSVCWQRMRRDLMSETARERENDGEKLC